MMQLGRGAIILILSMLVTMRMTMVKAMTATVISLLELVGGEVDGMQREN